MHPSLGRENQKTAVPPVWAAAGGIAIAACAVYGNTLAGPLVYDDRVWITGNPAIQNLRSIGAVLFPPADSVVYGRPFLSLSLALNYALGGENAWGYHLVNLVIHVLAALALLGIVARTLAYRPLWFPTERDRNLASFAVALIWAVHPLQTESVTYVSQRAESLMGLLYLLTLYCFIRGVQAARPAGWPFLCVLCCLLGMATKEVMVTAPLLVLAYDRTFVAGDFRGALRHRWGLYLGLACTWTIVGLLSVGLRGRGVGYGLGYSWWAYGLAECWAVGHYLTLAIWPHPLVFDYGTEIIGSLRETLPWACVLASLIGVTLVAFRRRSALGFAGFGFFLILAPASSIVPVAFQPMAEHRMYLPLAAVATVAVCGAWAWLGRRSLLLVPAAALALGIAAFVRNGDYRSDVSLWADTARRRPANPRARLALGEALARESRHAEAAEQFREAMRLDPGDFHARMNLGVARYNMGRLEEALATYQGIVPPTPDSALLHYNMGLALEGAGRADEARARYHEALRLHPGYAEALRELRRLDEQGPAVRP